ncbi:restriction endonuclease subunit R [Bacillus sp. VT 712]|uniref:type I restriction endonuclease subunit R n=1 Tax=Bacillaceae TaxID=186817 RepID=UPI00047394E9|nr:MULTISPECIES: type I restriction endonuclease [Bacillaceae]KZB90376.1 restriction endonuclease subunit R [Bacillus sp. VT 712]
MAIDRSEKALESLIEAEMLGMGYVKGHMYNRDTCIDQESLIEFIRDSQPIAWQNLEKHFKSETPNQIFARLTKELELRGTLEVLRKGIDLFGTQIKLAYFKPEHRLSDQAIERYKANRLTVSRQVYYSNQHQNSLDIVLGLNGIPIVTMELKNQPTGQNVNHAKRQYKRDRDPRETMFKFLKHPIRTLVHFAVDADLVYMTTRLAGESTYFLPFNRGKNGGAGNPTIDGFRTSYLWREVLTPDSLLDILQRFMHLQVEEKSGKRKETMIFPRYHQLNAVRKLILDVKENGAGESYLIQHSAGSGKSNTIAWLSHRLSGLHKDDEPVFHSTIVITDRVVLDRQLQGTISQFEQTLGVVQKIDDSSSQLADAIQTGKKIIITTLQKFPFILDKIEQQEGKRFAVIMDEAHSSQSGETAQKVREALRDYTVEERKGIESELFETSTDSEAELIKEVSKRGKPSNISFFAFTATPKAKTLEMFGTYEGDLPRPFHLYTMRQAIEEGFIEDVLANYMTYKMYYKLSKAIEDDPEVDQKKAKKALTRYMALHPYNAAQKADIIVEHYKTSVRHKIGGEAKAMIVTGSRQQALLFYRAVQRTIKEKGYPFGAVVAFSGSLYDDVSDGDVTEVQLNGFAESELPKQFATSRYHFLIVADKYQTGFDQPLLHTMYVDKKLSGIQAVQTLSRLNRTHRAKQDTFVLDFVNEAEDIYASFKPYYEATNLSDITDLNLIYDLKNRVYGYQVFTQSEVDEYAEVFFRPQQRQRKGELAELHRIVDRAVDRYNSIPETEQAECKSALSKYIRSYSYISQIAPFTDAGLHKLFVYVQMLAKKLPNTSTGGLQLDDEVQLTYYRLEKTFEGEIDLSDGEAENLAGLTDSGTVGMKEEEKDRLSIILDLVNERFGTDFKSTDRVFFEQAKEEMLGDEITIHQAKNSSRENFVRSKSPQALKSFMTTKNSNEQLFRRLFTDKDFQETVLHTFLNDVYEAAQDVELRD